MRVSIDRWWDLPNFVAVPAIWMPSPVQRCLCCCTVCKRLDKLPQWSEVIPSLLITLCCPNRLFAPNFPFLSCKNPKWNEIRSFFSQKMLLPRNDLYVSVWNDELRWNKFQLYSGLFVYRWQILSNFCPFLTYSLGQIHLKLTKLKFFYKLIKKIERVYACNFDSPSSNDCICVKCKHNKVSVDFFFSLCVLYWNALSNSVAASSFSLVC